MLILCRRWFPAALWFVFIFCMSTAFFSKEQTLSVIASAAEIFFPTLSHHEIAMINKIVRKGAHAFEYCILGLLLFRSFQSGNRKEWSWKASFFAFFGVLLWAIGDEFHQSFVTVRQASVRDIAIDTTGGMLGQIVNAFWYRYLAR